MAGTNPLVPTQHDFIRIDREMDPELIDTGDNVLFYTTYPYTAYRFGTIIEVEGDLSIDDSGSHVIHVECDGNKWVFDTSVDELYLLQERHS